MQIYFFRIYQLYNSPLSSFPPSSPLSGRVPLLETIWSPSHPSIHPEKNPSFVIASYCLASPLHFTSSPAEEEDEERSIQPRFSVLLNNNFLPEEEEERRESESSFHHQTNTHIYWGKVYTVWYPLSLLTGKVTTRNNTAFSPLFLRRGRPYHHNTILSSPFALCCWTKERTRETFVGRGILWKFALTRGHRPRLTFCFNTNLYVRYDSWSQGTLEKLGKSDRGVVASERVSVCWQNNSHQSNSVRLLGRISRSGFDLSTCFLSTYTVFTRCAFLQAIRLVREEKTPHSEIIHPLTQYWFYLPWKKIEWNLVWSKI